MTTKIYSIHFNKPQYIKAQLNSFKLFFKKDFSFTVINNSPDESMKEQIEKEAKALGVEHVDTNNIRTSDYTRSHINALNNFVLNLKEGDDVILIDHDIFLIDTFNDNEYNQYDLAFLPQARGKTNYPWPGLMIFNNIKYKNDMNLDCGVVNNDVCDSGGKFYYYLQKYKDLKIKYITERRENEGENFVEILDDVFLHLKSGSGWNENYDLKDKLDFINKKYNINI